jgi:hypothetical protein
MRSITTKKWVAISGCELSKFVCVGMSKLLLIYFAYVHEKAWNIRDVGLHDSPFFDEMRRRASAWMIINPSRWGISEVVSYQVDLNAKTVRVESDC